MGEYSGSRAELPKNIRQIGERDEVVRLYVEDYVNTYLKQVYPSGGPGLRVGLLLQHPAALLLRHMRSPLYSEWLSRHILCQISVRS